MSGSEPAGGHRSSVRPAVAGDAVGMARLAGELGYPAVPETVAERLREISRLADHRVLVVEAGGAVAAWIHVHVTLRLESSRFAEIGGLVVAGDWRGRGLGRMLVEAAREWAGELRCTALRVRTRTDRQDARAFYRALGFEELKTQVVLALSPPAAAPPE